MADGNEIREPPLKKHKSISLGQLLRGKMTMLVKL